MTKSQCKIFTEGSITTFWIGIQVHPRSEGHLARMGTPTVQSWKSDRTPETQTEPCHWAQGRFACGEPYNEGSEIWRGTLCETDAMTLIPFGPCVGQAHTHTRTWTAGIKSSQCSVMESSAILEYQQVLESYFRMFIVACPLYIFLIYMNTIGEESPGT